MAELEVSKVGRVAAVAFGVVSVVTLRLSGSEARGRVGEDLASGSRMICA